MSNYLFIGSMHRGSNHSSLCCPYKISSVSLGIEMKQDKMIAIMFLIKKVWVLKPLSLRNRQPNTTMWSFSFYANVCRFPNRFQFRCKSLFSQLWQASAVCGQHLKCTFLWNLNFYFASQFRFEVQRTCDKWLIWRVEMFQLVTMLNQSFFIEWRYEWCFYRLSVRFQQSR